MQIISIVSNHCYPEQLLASKSFVDPWQAALWTLMAVVWFNIGQGLGGLPASQRRSWLGSSATIAAVIR